MVPPAPAGGRPWGVAGRQGRRRSTTETVASRRIVLSRCGAVQAWHGRTGSPTARHAKLHPHTHARRGGWPRIAVVRARRPCATGSRESAVARCVRRGHVVGVSSAGAVATSVRVVT